ncbi:hypothetical protein [Dictyobacter formicarum]|uniref:Uncharacterized protein n=1 Tax=Dictyobacter formicarum TaxID=2778368 RepID=A0ABQ3VNS3_9CHLR|nr:hypothetical protein [Dictyobacter formicarum]GHO87450.1 hypothetical protein KSZ_54560 [Dictyobacter formicarum]
MMQTAHNPRKKDQQTSSYAAMMMSAGPCALGFMLNVASQHALLPAFPHPYDRPA